MGIKFVGRQESLAVISGFRSGSRSGFRSRSSGGLSGSFLEPAKSSVLRLRGVEFTML